MRFNPPRVLSGGHLDLLTFHCMCICISTGDASAFVTTCASAFAQVVRTHGGAYTMWPDAPWIPADRSNPVWEKIFGGGPPGGDPPDKPWTGCLAKLN